MSGTPPEAMLAAPRAKQVAGDDLGGFYRAVRDVLPPDDEADHEVEAYHWGRFTSGAATSAAWLLLLPFGVVNAARFMLPPAEDDKRRAHAIARAGLRVVGLALTLVMTLTLAVVLIDLVAWQWLGDKSIPWVWWRAAALLGTAALPLGCLWLTHAGRARAQDDDGGSQPTPLPPPLNETRRAANKLRSQESLCGERPPDRPRLARPAFLADDPHARALQRLHLAAGLLLPAVLGLRALDPGWAHSGLFWAAYGLLGVIAVIVAMAGIEDPIEGEKKRRVKGLRLTAQVALVGATALLFLTLVLTFTIAPAPPVSDHHPGVESACLVLMFLALLAWLTLAVANAILVRPRPLDAAERRFSPFARGLTPTIATTLAISVSIGFAGGASAAVATVLEQLPAKVVVEAPGTLELIARGWGVTVVVATFVALVVFGHFLVTRKIHRERARELFAEAFLPKRWISRIATARWRARLKNSIVAILCVPLGVGALLTLDAAIGTLVLLIDPNAAPVGQAPSYLASVSGIPDAVLNTLTALGTVALGFLAGRLVLLGRQAATEQVKRRGLNVVWDVIAFWPRSIHPFIPPPYASGAVPRLEKRACFHLQESRGGQDAIVLCGHSQGSLIVFTTALRLVHNAGVQDKIGMLTFGSQLQVLFARGFPAYVNLALIRSLHKDLDGRWRNLYRETDPLAGPVLSWDHHRNPSWVGRETPTRPLPEVRDRPESKPVPGPRKFGPDWMLFDPPMPDRERQGRPLVHLRGHGSFWTDRAWPIAVLEVLPPGGPPSHPRQHPYPLDAARTADPEPLGDASPDPYREAQHDHACPLRKTRWSSNRRTESSRRGVGTAQCRCRAHLQGH